MTATARILLAVAVAALLLAGCGGDSSGSPSSSTPNGAASTTSGSDSSGSGGSSAADTSGSTGGPGSGGPSAKGVTGSGAAAGGGGEQHSSGGKHGPSVPQPTSPEEPGITPQQRREATVADISLQSPSSRPSAAGPQALPVQYTCDGDGTSPALRWQGVPQGTAELVLFAMNVRPVGGELFFDWAVAGLSPELEEIEAGKLPRGAVVGRNSFGKADYKICPEGGGETYMFTLFALPKGLSPARGFDPSALRKAVLEVSGNAGLLALSYTRG
jgi:phosphatidylethanolamine-binding protein (PEBP) family uncharacterized protein